MENKDSIIDLTKITKGGIANLTKRLERIENKIDTMVKSDQMKLSDLYTVEQTYGGHRYMKDKDEAFKNPSKIPINLNHCGKLCGCIYYNEKTEETFLVVKDGMGKPMYYSLMDKAKKMFEARV